MEALIRQLQYQTISLSEMGKVRLMKRVDTKYVISRRQLEFLLERLPAYYFVQEIDGRCSMPYYTLYYDTPDRDMYHDHRRGRSNRKKIRIRIYRHSGQAYLEVKHKSGNGRTTKHRQAVEGEHHHLPLSAEFLQKHCQYELPQLQRTIENKFERITLVSKNLDERVTIDTALRYRNHQTHQCCSLEDLVIIELKRDGHRYSRLREVLNDMLVRSSSFSKYCVGMILTDNTLKQNNFKEKLHPLSYRVPSLRQCYER